MAKPAKDRPRLWLQSDASVFPKTGTDAARDFYLAFAAVTRFANYVLGLVVAVSRMSDAAREALKIIDDEILEQSSIDPGDEEVRSHLVELVLNRQSLLEVLLARHVDNYLNYLSFLLFEVFTQRPECMKSSEQVKLEFVLEHTSMEGLVRDIAERKVEALSYSSFSSLAEFFDEHFSLAISTPDKADVLNESIETRNIVVHNRGIINQRYVTRTGKRQDQLGKRRTLSEHRLEVVVGAIRDSVISLDRNARRHLRIKGHRIDVASTLEGEYDSAMQEYREFRERHT